MIRKISEFKDEEAIDLVADMLPIIVNIVSDPQVQKILNGKKKLTLAEIAGQTVKLHKTDIMKLMNLLTDEEEYHCNPVSLLTDLLSVLNDKELMAFFDAQGISITEEPSGDATETITAED